MYRIAVCDDQIETVLHISKMISQNFGSQYKVYKYESSVALEFFIDDSLKGQLDILIIDIELIADNGIEVAKRINNKYPNIKIIFSSGYSSYAGDIFDAKPVYFLIKPVKQDKLVAAIKSAIQSIQSDNKEIITLTSKGLICNIDLRETMYIESYNRTALFCFSNIKKEFYIKLNELELMLTDRYVRCHQSYLVNLDYVTEISMYQLSLLNGKTIPISQSKYKDVKNQFMRFLGKAL